MYMVFQKSRKDVLVVMVVTERKNLKGHHETLELPITFYRMKFRQMDKKYKIIQTKKLFKNYILSGLLKHPVAETPCI